jgi:nucleolar protein 56
MPASRVQLLGAETALYRFLKTGKGIPKHGLIFQWNQIRGSKPWVRGKISRVVSGKIGLAAKIDHFKGDFIGNEISEDLSRKIKEIEIRHPKPPKKAEPKKTSKPKPRTKKKPSKGGRKY